MVSLSPLIRWPNSLCHYSNTVYVLTGPLYEKLMPSLPNTEEPHKIPSGYWKVVAIEKDSEVLTASFIFDQDTLRRAKYCSNLNSFEQVEKRSGLGLFGDIAVKGGGINVKLCK